MEGTACTTVSGKLVADESVGAGSSTNDMVVPEMISKALFQSNVLNSAGVATQGTHNSAVESIRELGVSTMAVELAASDSAAVCTTLDCGATAFGVGAGSVDGLAASGSAAGVSTTQGGEMLVIGAAQQLTDDPVKPVFYMEFLTMTMSALRRVCFYCSKLVVTPTKAKIKV